MKKTCGLFVAGLLIATVAYFVAIRRYMPEIPTVPSIGMAVLGGFSALALFGAISGFVQAISDRNVIARALKHTPYSDGKRAAAIGTIHSAGLATIQAPFSGNDCLAYEYEVYELIEHRSRSGTKTTKKLYCSGFGMTPSQVRTSLGEIRILGFPILDEFPKNFIDEHRDRARAQEYIASTKFKDFKANLASIFSEFDDVFTDSDGAVRKDLGEPVQIEDKYKVTEIGVSRGAEVCAIGVYSAKDHALVAKTSALPIRLVPGNAAAAQKRLQRTGITQIALAMMFFLIINGVFAFVFRSLQQERYNMTESEQAASILQAAEARDFEKLEWLFQNGVNPNATDSETRTVLQTTQDDEVARLLLKFGANPNVQDPETLETPVFQAARTGNLQRIKILIEGGADVNAVCSIPWKHTPVDEAIRAGQFEAVDLLIQAGASDPRITAANGNPLAPNGGEQIAAIRSYLRAIQREDRETMKSLNTQRYEYFFDDIDFSVWKASYPVTIESFEGYANDVAATIHFRGPRVNGRDTEWICQMEKQADGWKIHQTWPIAE